MSNDLTGFGAAAKKLIEVISRGIGAALAPWQTRRLARAEADALLIAAEADIRRRALLRREEEGILEQRNIELVTALALPHLQSDAKPEQIDRDWLSYFFAQCRIVSGEALQSIWAQILAGEANSPGRFSLRTLSIVSTIGQSDAKQFEVLSRFAWTFLHEFEERAPIVLAWQHVLYQEAGLTFEGIMNLRSIGLIDYANTPDFSITFKSRRCVARYFDRALTIETPETPAPALPESYGWAIPAGHFLFTKAGKELSTLPCVEPVPNYFEYVRGVWMQRCSQAGYRFEET